MIIKHASHPQCNLIHGTVSGARMAPTLAPELNMPVANDLSFLGKYSAVALMAAGKLPASPNANIARENIKPKTDTEKIEIPIHPRAVVMPSPIGIDKAWIRAPSDQIIMAMAYPFLVPSLSIIRPANNIENAYTN